MTTNPSKPFNHAEAYCVMKYSSRDGSVVEYLWNSRDGVTPFCIHTDAGVELHHVDWGGDRYDRNHVCVPGERIFVDMTKESKEALAKQYVERWWREGMSEVYASKDEAIAAQVRDLSRGEPDIYTVQEGDHWTKRIGGLSSEIFDELQAVTQVQESKKEC